MLMGRLLAFVEPQVSWLKRKVRTRVFLEWNFSKGLHIFRELSPMYERVGLGTVRVQRQTPCKPTRSPICKHPSQLQDNLDTGVGRGDCKVATPACAQARPSAPAISAGRSGRTRTPLPAAQRPAKVTPAPPVGSQTPAQPGVDLPHRRAGARRALAGTRIQHRTPTERHAWPCRLQ